MTDDYTPAQLRQLRRYYDAATLREWIAKASANAKFAKQGQVERWRRALAVLENEEVQTQTINTNE